MAEPIVIRVEYDIQRISPNTRLNPHERRRRETCVRNQVIARYHELGDPWLEPVVDLRVHVARAKKLDNDNVVIAIKRIRDCICCRKKFGYGIVEDDSPDFFGQTLVTQDASKDHKGKEFFELHFTSRNRDGQNGT